ncbi:hypothetical protein KC368_g84 [Hortaea werneckii]|nr:hypothetical protein KC368_g84 [Hortaea werneckii]
MSPGGLLLLTEAALSSHLHNPTLTSPSSSLATVHVIPGKFNAVLSKVGSFFHANDVHCHLDSCRLLRPIA